jgi:uncharacterized OsmC-like protein
MRTDPDLLRANVEDTADRLRADPEAGHVRPSVVTSLVENVHATSDFVQYGKHFSFACDESDGRAGRGSAPSPLRYFLSGIAFCLQVWYAKGAALVGCPLEDLRIEVRTYMDMRGEHRLGDVPPHPQWIVVEADVTTPAPDETVLAMVDEADARCPVSTLVGMAVPIYERIRVDGRVLRDTIPDGLEEA